MSGKVIHGEKRGRELGYPTANIEIYNSYPINGIFLVSILFEDKKLYGLASWGNKPTFSGEDHVREVKIFNFETDIYNKFSIPNEYVGHPLADKLPTEPNTQLAREKLSIPLNKKVIALLPGSRLTEIKRIGVPLLKAALIAQNKHNDLFFVSSLADKKASKIFKELKMKVTPKLNISIYTEKTHRVIESANIILLASGTVSLEAMLLKKPMIVAYKLSWPTYFIVKLLSKIQYASLPNILAGENIVPECLQFNCRAKVLASELDKLLNSDKYIKKVINHFTKLSIGLRKKADYKAANAILKLVESNNANR